MSEMTARQRASAFWSLLVIIVIGNAVLLGALVRSLYWDEGSHAEWLISGFAAEIVAGFMFAWKFYFQTPSNSSDRADPNVGTQSSEVKTSDVLENQISDQLNRQVYLAGITKVIPARRYYPEFGSTLPEHVNACSRSLVMVSINLMTGLPFENLLEIFESKLAAIGRFTVTISLLNPNRSDLMITMGASLSQSGEQLATSINETLSELWVFKTERLSPENASRFHVCVHNAIPFGSAIIRDHESDHGNLQIETKVYRAPINSSFAIEFAAGSESELYERLRDGYLDLIQDGHGWMPDRS